jgi:hypothetical protein
VRQRLPEGHRLLESRDGLRVGPQGLSQGPVAGREHVTGLVAGRLRQHRRGQFPLLPNSGQAAGPVPGHPQHVANRAEAAGHVQPRRGGRLGHGQLPSDGQRLAVHPEGLGGFADLRGQLAELEIPVRQQPPRLRVRLCLDQAPQLGVERRCLLQ